MKKILEFIKKCFKNKTSMMITCTILGIVVALLLFITLYNKNYKVDNEYIMGKLEKASELTTAKLTYRGFSEFKDTGIVIINRSDFLMVYTATARAGIDMKDVKVSSNKFSKTVSITIPKAKILEVKVDPNNIKYYDEGFALFNLNSKEDANKAQALAEENAKEELAKMGILKMADNQAESLIKGIIQDSIPNDYKIEVKIK